MGKLTAEEKRFFEMINSKSTRKISLNLSAGTADKIDELAKIFKITRTLVIESIIAVGLKEYLQVILRANKQIKSQNKYKNNKNLDEMAMKITEFKKKWGI